MNGQVELEHTRPYLQSFGWRYAHPRRVQRFLNLHGIWLILTSVVVSVDSAVEARWVRWVNEVTSGFFLRLCVKMQFGFEQLDPNLHIGWMFRHWTPKTQWGNLVQSLVGWWYWHSPGVFAQSGLNEAGISFPYQIVFVSNRFRIGRLTRICNVQREPSQHSAKTRKKLDAGKTLPSELGRRMCLLHEMLRWLVVVEQSNSGSSF